MAAVVFYGVGKRAGGGAEMEFLDAVFLGITSATGAGHGNVVLSRLDTLQQVLACFLILAGSQVWVAACVVNIQRALLARKILKRCEEEKKKKLKREAELRAQLSGNAKGGEDMEKQDELLQKQVLSSPPMCVSPAAI